ncbi:nucleoid-associated protein [Motiliproteus sp.]|uniref:nucleoid-associated protein n=1 Tax=Motiliproteus sp. TaxID=1898955 RepID=UPI003BA8759B
MAVSEAIVHQIHKPEGAPAQLSPRQTLLTISDSVETLISKLSAGFNNRSGKLYGGFELDQQEYPFSRWLAGYRQDEIDFVQLTRQSAERFRTALDTIEEAVSGYLLFARMEVLGADQLLVLLLSSSPALVIDEQLELSDSQHLDVGKVQLGCRIDLQQWQAAESSQYLALVRSRTGKGVNEAFRQALGATEEVDAKQQTQTLLKVFNDYCDQEQLPPKQASEVKQKAYEYCQERVDSGERVQMRELSCVIDTTDPDKFYNYVGEQDEDLNAEIPADKRGLQRFVRYSGSMKGLSLSFSESLLGDQLLYDADTDTLTIRGLPPTLRKQLARNG